MDGSRGAHSAQAVSDSDVDHRAVSTASDRQRVVAVAAEALSESNDQCLVALLRDPSHHEAAFSEIVRRYRDQLRRTCLRAFPGDKALADEAEQRTWIRLLRNAERLDPDSNLPAWLRRCATRLCLNLQRDETRRHRHHGRAAAIPAQTPPSKFTAEQFAMMREAIARLPAGQRSIIQAHCLDGLPQSEVAERHRISVPAVRQRIYEAMGNLRAMLRHSERATGAGLLLVLLGATAQTSAAETVASAMPRPRPRSSRGPQSPSTGRWPGIALVGIPLVAVAIWLIALPAKQPELRAPEPVASSQLGFELGKTAGDLQRLPGLTLQKPVVGDHGLIVITSSGDSGTDLHAKLAPGSDGLVLTMGFTVTKTATRETNFIEALSYLEALTPQPWMGSLRQSGPTMSALPVGRHQYVVEALVRVLPTGEPVYEVRQMLDGRLHFHDWFTGIKPEWVLRLGSEAGTLTDVRLDQVKRMYHTDR